MLEGRPGWLGRQAMVEVDKVQAAKEMWELGCV